MFANQALHPHHVVPTAELQSAFVEMRHQGKAHTLVKVHTLQSKIRVMLNGRKSDARIHVQDALLPKPLLKRPIQPHYCPRKKLTIQYNSLYIKSL